MTSFILSNKVFSASKAAEHAWGGGGGGGGGQTGFLSSIAKQAMEFPQVLASLVANTLAHGTGVIWLASQNFPAILNSNNFKNC